MQIEQLRYVVEVAKSASISKAAAVLHISQSAISQSISSLEKELNIILFNRSKHGSFPTPEGKKFIKKAQEILSKMEELKSELQSDPLSGVLRVSCSPAMVRFIIRTVKRFRDHYPHIIFEMEEKGSSRIITDLHQNQADIGLAILYDDLLRKCENIEFNMLLNGVLKVYAHKDDPLALRGSIKLYELKEHPFVFYRSELSKKFIDDFTQAYGPINTLFISNSTAAINKSIREGLAISVIPDFCVMDDPYVLNGDIVPIEITDYPGALVSFGWIRSKLYPPTLPIQKFVEHLDYEFSQSETGAIKKNHPAKALSSQGGSL